MLELDLRPTRQTSEELKAVAAIGPDKLNELAARFTEEISGSYSPNRISEIFTAILEDESLSLLAEKHIMSMAALRRRRNCSADEVVENIAAGCRELGWTEDDENSWNLVADSFVQILETRLIDSTEKAVSLYYQHDNVWLSSNIVTDIRPVFDDERETINAIVLTHTFRIFYRGSDGRNREFGVSMDLDDVKLLIDVCEKALRKAGAAKSLMLNKADLPVIDFGENE